MTIGPLTSDTAEELWDAVEYVLGQADGRLVVADLSAVTDFEAEALDILAILARDASRRACALYMVLTPGSGLHRQLSRERSVDQSLLFNTLAEALARTAIW